MDAAINFKEHCVGLGVVIGDATNKYVAVAIKVTKLHSDVTFAEAEVVNLGLSIANRAGLSTIIVESDSQDVIDFVNNRKSNKT